MKSFVFTFDCDCCKDVLQFFFRVSDQHCVIRISLIVYVVTPPDKHRYGFRPKIYLARPVDTCKLKAVEGYKNVNILRPSVAFIISKHTERQCPDLRH